MVITPNNTQSGTQCGILWLGTAVKGPPACRFLFQSEDNTAGRRAGHLVSDRKYQSTDSLILFLMLQAQIGYPGACHSDGPFRARLNNTLK